MIKIEEIKSREAWDKFTENNPAHTFLHSWNWGDFNESMGDKVFRLGIYDEGVLKGVTLAIKIKARRGSFIFIPHGPVLVNPSGWHEKCLTALFIYLKKVAISENCAFIRINPILPKNADNERLFKELGFRKAPLYIHAELLWLLDITPNDTELLKGMRKTTRYSINKAVTDGVTVEKSEDIRDLETFNKLYEATFSRQHFVPFSQEYLRKEFSAFSAGKKIAIFFAKYTPTGESVQSEVVSSAIIVYENNEAFYHHGASSQKFPKVTPTHLLQWEIIRDAKARGCKFYNFWGIAPENKPKHPMAGLSLFKKGFGGFLEELVPAQDLIINPKYWFSFAVEKIRKIKRGL